MGGAVLRGDTGVQPVRWRVAQATIEPPGRPFQRWKVSPSTVSLLATGCKPVAGARSWPAGRLGRQRSQRAGSQPGLLPVTGNRAARHPHKVTGHPVTAVRWGRLVTPSNRGVTTIGRSPVAATPFFKNSTTTSFTPRVVNAGRCNAKRRPQKGRYGSESWLPEPTQWLER